MTIRLTIRLTFSGLMGLISQALVAPAIAEHVFANKDKIAEAMGNDKTYSFLSPTGETIEIRKDEHV